MTACVAAFLLLLAYKLGIVEKMQLLGPDIIAKMAHCDFCMSWWLSVMLAVVFMIIFKDWTFVFVPFVSTPIARRLI